MNEHLENIKFKTLATLLILCLLAIPVNVLVYMWSDMTSELFWKIIASDVIIILLLTVITKVTTDLLDV